mgnify:FL=1
MNAFFGSVFWLLVTLGVLVTFHEFGHYWVARRCGVKVLRFSVGFGRALWSRTGRDGCEYQVAAIPLGGYVKMLDAREGEVDPALRGQEFTAKPVWQRIAIVAAGPAFNLLFTVVALWLMFMLGKPDIAPIVTAAPHSLAAEAGLQVGDRIQRIDGEPVSTWSDALDAIANATLGRQPLPMVVTDADGLPRSLTLPLQQLPAGQDVGRYLDTLGLRLASPPAMAATVVPGQPAAAAGLQSGDLIRRVNGQPVADFEDFRAQVARQAAQNPVLQLQILRGDQLLERSVTARKEALQGGAARWLIGIGSQPPVMATLRYGPLKAVGAALTTTWHNTRQSFNLIGKMLSGQASPRNLSGVIGIAQVANSSAHMGLAWFLNFLAMVSLSLAVINLLPIPVLDGGHLLYYLIELVKGSPVNERVMLAGQYVGLVLLFTLMGLAFYNDIHRILSS